MMALAQQAHLHAAAPRQIALRACNTVRHTCLRLPATRAPFSMFVARQQQREARVAAAAAWSEAPSPADLSDAVGGVEPSSLSSDLTDVLLYAMNLAWTSQTYEVHSWMVLLGILRNEGSTAAQLLSQLGLDDLYGAWHEVLWALNASDGLKPRAFTPKLRFAPRARKIVDAAVTLAGQAGRDIVKSEDMLLALAAGGVLEHLFPDVDLEFDSVKSCIERNTGCAYDLPGYQPSKVEQDMFL